MGLTAWGIFEGREDRPLAEAECFFGRVFC
jgi:hypothetical protein